ncbi:hypothetical protein D3C80_1478840 [compost metagenome]
MRPFRIKHQAGSQTLVTGIVTGNGGFKPLRLQDPVALHRRDEDGFLVLESLVETALRQFHRIGKITDRGGVIPAPRKNTECSIERAVDIELARPAAMALFRGIGVAGIGHDRNIGNDHFQIKQK